MKLKNLRYIQMLSVIMTLFVIVSFVPAVAVNDGAPQDSQAGAESVGQGGESQEATEQETESFSISFEAEEDRGSSELGTAGDAGDQTRLPPTALADGVYMLENLYHTGYYMSVRGASLDAGARIVPRQYSSGTPISTFDRQALFKISKVPGTTRYVIRSMLNNGIGLGIVNGKVVTKELPFDDADVSADDTFTIIGLQTSGYQINPYVGGGILAAELGTMSDDPSVGAYVVQGNASTVGNRGKWTLTAYTGIDQYGFDGTETNGIEDGVAKGTTGTISINSWSTIIGANTPYITIDSTYLSIVDFDWSALNSQATFEGIKCDDFQINLEIRTGSSQTATHTAVRGYTVIPDIVGKTAFVKNVATGKYMEIENASTLEGGVIQQWAYHTASHMQWIFELDGNGFFRIKSVKSGKYLGANSSNVSEVKQYGTVTDYLRWKIVETSSGNYKLVCKASTWRKSVLAIPATTSGDGVDLTIQTTYTDDSSYNDEWNIEVCSIINSVPTSLRSNSNHLCISCAITNVAAHWSVSGFYQFGCSTSSQQETVAQAVHQKMLNEGGSATANKNIQIGFDFFSHSEGDIEYVLQSENIWRSETNFSIQTIMDSIDSGNPVMLGFAGTSDSPYGGAHMTVCVGYQVEGNNCYVFVSDAHTSTYQKYLFNSSTYNDFISIIECVIAE